MPCLQPTEAAIPAHCNMSVRPVCSDCAQIPPRDWKHSPYQFAWEVDTPVSSRSFKCNNISCGLSACSAHMAGLHMQAWAWKCIDQACTRALLAHSSKNGMCAQIDTVRGRTGTRMCIVVGSKPGYVPETQCAQWLSTNLYKIGISGVCAWLHGHAATHVCIGNPPLSTSCLPEAAQTLILTRLVKHAATPRNSTDPQIHQSHNSICVSHAN